MARPRSPDGRRIPVSFKLTEAEAALADSLRGETERSTWLREMAFAHVRELQDSRIRETLGVKIVVDDRQPPGSVSVAALGKEATEVRAFALAPETAPKPKNCKHPSLKLSKGVCPDCKEWAVKS